MAKKKKRKRRRPPPRRAQRRPAAASVPPVSAAPTVSAEAVPTVRSTRFKAAARSAAPRDWAHEYRYVIKDLKRMAITTAAMFALLFVLAIVVPLFLY